MEVVLNSVWALFVAGAIGGSLLCSHRRSGGVQYCLILVCIGALWFPIVSISDDHLWFEQLATGDCSEIMKADGKCKAALISHHLDTVTARTLAPMPQWRKPRHSADYTIIPRSPVALRELPGRSPPPRAPRQRHLD
jgi:hypothetical protein